jgi:death-on-curing protein
MVEEIRYLSHEQVSRLYKRIIETTGGEHGFLSKSNLEYLLDTVRDVGERFPMEKAVVKKAGFLLYNVIVIHPFLNGNKRTAYEMVRNFLASNGYDLSIETKESYRFLLDIASGKVSESEVEKWIARHLSESGEE